MKIKFIFLHLFIFLSFFCIATSEVKNKEDILVSLKQKKQELNKLILSAPNGKKLLKKINGYKLKLNAYLKKEHILDLIEKSQKLMHQRCIFLTTNKTAKKVYNLEKELNKLQNILWKTKDVKEKEKLGNRAKGILNKLVKEKEILEKINQKRDQELTDIENLLHKKIGDSKFITNLQSSLLKLKESPEFNKEIKLINDRVNKKINDILDLERSAYDKLNCKIYKIKNFMLDKTKMSLVEGKLFT